MAWKQRLDGLLDSKPRLWLSVAFVLTFSVATAWLPIRVLMRYAAQAPTDVGGFLGPYALVLGLVSLGVQLLVWVLQVQLIHTGALLLGGNGSSQKLAQLSGYTYLPLALATALYVASGMRLLPSSLPNEAQSMQQVVQSWQADMLVVLAKSMVQLTLLAVLAAHVAIVHRLYQLRFKRAVAAVAVPLGCAWLVATWVQGSLFPVVAGVPQ